MATLHAPTRRQPRPVWPEPTPKPRTDRLVLLAYFLFAVCILLFVALGGTHWNGLLP